MDPFSGEAKTSHDHAGEFFFCLWNGLLPTASSSTSASFLFQQHWNGWKMSPEITMWHNSGHPPKARYLALCCHKFPCLNKTSLLQESPKSCPSTQSTWLLTRKAIFLPLHLFPSASTKGRASCLEENYLNLTTLQCVTSFSQPSLKDSSATRLTLQSLDRTKESQQNQADGMVFCFC